MPGRSRRAPIRATLSRIRQLIQADRRARPGSTTSGKNRCAGPTLRIIILVSCALVVGCAMKAIIVGGGAGGLTAALMLHARGIDCEIFEQSDAVRELGVGINTLPHAIKELAELGLLPRLDAVAIRTYELFYTNCLGQEIWREPRGLDAGYDVPQFSIHRGRLQGVLYQAVRARLGETRIHLGCRLAWFNQDDGGVTAYFFDRGGSHRLTTRGDVLVGADGIHSVVRERLYPN